MCRVPREERAGDHRWGERIEDHGVSAQGTTDGASEGRKRGEEEGEEEEEESGRNESQDE